MNKKLKVFAATISIVLNFSLPGFASTTTLSTSTQISNAQKYVTEALSEKTFYKYNVAYEAVMAIQDTTLQTELLEKLSRIANDVWTDDVKEFNSLLTELVNTQGSGEVYDKIQALIAESSLTDVDKAYLLGELSSWGKKLVYTDDYTTAINKIVSAWNDLSTNDTTKISSAISNADSAITSVNNSYSKKYLQAQLLQIKNKKAIDALVTAGTITSDQETAVLNILNTNKNDGKSGIETQLDALVTDGTLTQAQETAVLDALKPADNGKSNSNTNGRPGQDGMKTQLDALVTAGTITSAQETAVLNIFNTSDNGGPDGIKTQLDALVTDGTLTQAQETAVINALKPSNNGNKRPDSGPRGR